MTRRVAPIAVIAPALAGLLFLAALAGIRVARAGDISALIGFGCRSPAPCFAKLNQPVLPPRALVYASGGYDGQFFYYLAAEAAGGPRAVVDSDAFRRSRMGLAWLVAPAYWLGPRALTFAFPLALALAHALSTALLALRLHANGAPARAAQLALYAYACNPFTALAALLSVADGLALALALIGLLLLERGGAFGGARSTQPLASQAGGIFALAFAALTKETMLALIFAAGALPATLAALSGADFRRVLVALLYGVALLALIIAPTVFVWQAAGFSPALAAERGGVWFSGWRMYLSDADAFLSGRTMLAALLPALVALSPWCAWRAFVRLRAAKTHGASDSGAPWLALAAAAAGGALMLGAAATADEYWSTFPNIQRLFSLTAFALAAAGIALDSSGAPAQTAPRAAAWDRGVIYGLTALFGFGSLMLLKTELTGTMPLFFFLEHGP